MRRLLLAFFVLWALCFAVGAEPEVKQGLVEENGKLYFYQDDGTAFTGGYKVITQDGKRTYYYFQEDGTAYTDGYLTFAVDGKPYYFYFQEDGTAFTGGYKEVVLEGQTRYFYFLANGQGFNTGYKTAQVDGKKCYFYFGANGQAETDTLKQIPLGDRNAYMLFQENGRAFTGGYREQDDAYYYFLSNGQAFTTGYKTVNIDGTTYYFYFEETGKAFTGGIKQVAFGASSFPYYFGEDGRARTGWVEQEGKHLYFRENSRGVVDATCTVDGKLYYFDPSGARNGSGWNFGSDACYYGGEDGAILTDTIIDNYVVDQNGRSTTRFRILQYVEQLELEGKTDQEKIDAIYKWVLESDMHYYSAWEHTQSSWKWEADWVDYMAASHMDKWGGNCFRYAAFMGFMIREATGLPVQVHHGIIMGTYGKETAHGWVTVEQEGIWYVYDVELEKFTTYKADVSYKIPKEDSKIHLRSEATSLYPEAYGI